MIINILSHSIGAFSFFCCCCFCFKFMLDVDLGFLLFVILLLYPQSYWQRLILKISLSYFLLGVSWYQALWLKVSFGESCNIRVISHFLPVLYFSNTICWRYYLFPMGALGSLVQMLLTICGVASGLSILFHLSTFLFLCYCHMVLITIAEIRK